MVGDEIGVTAYEVSTACDRIRLAASELRVTARLLMDNGVEPDGFEASSPPARRSPRSVTSGIRAGRRCASWRRPRPSDRRHFGFPDPPWDLIGIYTQGRLLAPPLSG